MNTDYFTVINHCYMQRVCLLVLLVCLLAGCRKRNDHPVDPGDGQGQQPDPAVRIKSTNNNTFIYDTQGRLMRTTYGNSIVARTDYTYTRDSVSGRDVDLQGNFHGGSVTYYLRNDGLADSIRYIIDSSVPPLIIKLTYNVDRQPEGQLIAWEGGTADQRTVSYYTKGNLDSIRTFSLPGNELAEVVRFDYYTDRHNYLSNEHNGVSFTGMNSVSLLKKEVQEIRGTDTRVIAYAYEFDEKGRPVKRHMTLDGVPQPDLSYTWY